MYRVRTDGTLVKGRLDESVSERLKMLGLVEIFRLGEFDAVDALTGAVSARRTGVRSLWPRPSSERIVASDGRAVCSDDFFFSNMLDLKGSAGNGNRYYAKQSGSSSATR